MIQFVEKMRHKGGALRLRRGADSGWQAPLFSAEKKTG
jgi:hypothetical protein